MKKLISLVLTLALLISIATPAAAAKNEEFLSEVALIYKDSIEEAKAAIAGTEWKLWEQDLNANADYMFDDGARVTRHYLGADQPGPVTHSGDRANSFFVVEFLQLFKRVILYLSDFQGQVSTVS